MASARDRMIRGAADLISRQGLAATSVRGVAMYTGAPRGSIAHHFPGGRQELIEEAIEFADRGVADPLAALLARHGSLDGIRAFIRGWGKVLRESGFESGCAVLAAAIEKTPAPDGIDDPDAGNDERILDLARQAFAGWRKVLKEALLSDGAESHRADTLATLVVASIEGSIALCRADRSLRPLDDILVELERLIGNATR